MARTGKTQKGRGWMIALGLLLLVIALALLGCYWVFQVNHFSLSIELLGETNLILEYGESYEEPGAQVVFQGTKLCREAVSPEKAVLTIDGQVDEDTLGKYTVTYSARYLWWRAEAVRTVWVIDTVPPVITLTGDSEEALMPGTVYQEAGYHAQDNYDGDITDRVVRIEHVGKITYAVTDFSGNPAVAEREVPHHDPIPPEIYLEGGTDYRILTGTIYKEPGYSAVDNVDGDLTVQAAVEGQVDWLTPGVYPMTYSVSDAYGNCTTVTRNVTVEAAQRPETVYPEGKAIYLTFDDGPGPHTERLLDLLDLYGIKATFFVMDTGEYDLMRQIVERGHSIGIHTMSHNYREIYASPEAFFADLYGMQEIIFRETGVKTNLMRFPGGSSNEVSIRICEGIMTVLTEAVQNAGFRFFDWNVSSGDAGDTTKTSQVYDYVVSGVSQVDTAIVLQHDIHGYSVDAVEDILQWGFANGYQFLPLQENSPGFHQDVAN